MYGWMGTILRVNLTDEIITKELLTEELAHNYIGGRGLNAKLLYDELKPGIDPLGPDNKVLFGLGPVNGTIAPGSSRLTVSGKSPVTGFLGDTNMGPSFGVTLKYAGYDTIIVEGKAARPLYLWIDDGHVELRDASHLWGRLTTETKRILERENADPEISIVSIGPAGENLVRFACVMGDIGRAAGRTGMGAVMGSKKLKAIAVRGSQGVKIAHPKLLERIVREAREAYTKNSALYDQLTTYGFSYPPAVYQMLGILPTRNYKEGIFLSIIPHAHTETFTILFKQQFYP